MKHCENRNSYTDMKPLTKYQETLQVYLAAFESALLVNLQTHQQYSVPISVRCI
jgi:hypothetical protein